MPDEASAPNHLDSDDYNIYLYGEITHMAGIYVQQCISEAIVKGRTKHPQNMLISSGGGSVVSGLDIISTIRQAQAAGITIRARVNSMAGSMAAYIMLACDYRSMAPHAQLMLHGYEEGNHSGIDKKDRAAINESTKNMEQALIALVKERSNLTAEQVEKIFEDSSQKYYTAEQAIEAGLVDEVCW